MGLMQIARLPVVKVSSMALTITIIVLPSSQIRKKGKRVL